MKLLRITTLSLIGLIYLCISWAAPTHEIQDLVARPADDQISFTLIPDPKRTRLRIPDIRSGYGCPLRFVELKGNDPLTKSPRKVMLKDYLPRGGGKEAKTVLLMPPTGGENVLDWAYANSLCTRGFRVVLVSSWDYQDEGGLDPIMHDRGALRALAAMRHALDYINPTRPAQVGVLGTSVGAISAALGMGVDERIAAGFFIAGGVGMVDIIAESDEAHLKALREARMKAYGLADLDAYKDFLAQSIKVDPADFLSESAGNRPGYFVVATRDTTVQTANQEKFVDLFQNKRVARKRGNHKNVIIRTAIFDRDRVRNFFGSKLK